MYTSGVCVRGSGEKDMTGDSERERERVSKWGGVRLELFVSEAAANLSKNMFDPFNPRRGVNRPPKWCGGGTAQTVNRIFIILQR